MKNRFLSPPGILISAALLLLASITVDASELNVVTTTTTIADLTKEIGGKYINVQSISRGSQDPHYIEAKPSYMVLARNADLVIAVGLDLEQAWLPLVLRGSRNPKLATGKQVLKLGEHITAIDIPQGGSIDRSEGDIHPGGNPHFLMDPVRTAEVVPVIAKRLGELAPKHKSFFEKSASQLQKDILGRAKSWQERIEKSGVKQVITYHKTFEYFLRRFGITTLASIEPKPGVPPTARHTIGLINKAKEQKVRCILNESFFETTAAKRISESVDGQVHVLATEVGATDEAIGYTVMLESIVAAIEKCGGKSAKES